MGPVLRAFADGRIFGTTHGDGPPVVVALHGWRRTSRDFDAVLAGLDAVAVDLPGFGASPEPPEAWGSAGYAEALVPVLADELGAARTPLVVVGHSFGGRVAVELAAAHPTLVRGLVLSGVPLVRLPGRRPKRPALAFRAGRALHRLGLVGDERMERLRRRYGSSDYATATGVMRQVVVRVTGETYEEQLAALSCPVELVWGEHDEVAPPAVATASVALCRDARLFICAGAGHLVPTSAPDCLRAAVDRRLQPA